MQPSPLQLEKHFFSKVEINSHEDGVIGEHNLLRCNIETSRDAENSRRFRVVLRLKLDSSTDKQTTYTGDLHVAGMFLIAEAWPEEKRVSLLETAGVALLFGAAREMILTVTGRGPWPPLLLNTFTFAPHSDTKPAETCSLPDKTAYLENDATKQKITKLKKLTRSAKK